VLHGSVLYFTITGTLRIGCKERVQTAKERCAEAKRLRAYAGRARGEADGSAARGIAQMRQRLGML